VTDAAARLALQAFGLAHTDLGPSLCPYAPVHRVGSDGAYVLKRTGYPRSSGAAIAAWLRALRDAGVDVIAPVDAFKPNPRAIPGTDWPGEWVIYPFVSGNFYSAEPAQIAAAGALLGRMHAHSDGLGAGMQTAARLPLRDDAWIEQTRTIAVDVLGVTASAYLSATDIARCVGGLNAQTAQHAHERTTLESAALPLCACSWDFKASNLIYTSDAQPVLVDPDHAGVIPRLYDLACALILFHCDHAAAPARLFTAEEWRVFPDAYLSFVNLTASERALWPAIRRSAWADQGLWLIANWPEAWADIQARGYLRDIACAELGVYGLPV
jgi:Ser/Thr protein kinase RdoA (MazF antagonist)